MGRCWRSTLAPNNGAETSSPPSEGLGLGWSSSLANSAATRLDGDSMDHQANGHINKCEFFRVSCAEDAVSDSESKSDSESNSDSESESDSESDSDEEDSGEVGDDRWIDEEILATFKKPKDMAVILYQAGYPGDEDHLWMAIAPEWSTALGFGSTKEEACRDLELALAYTRDWFIEDKVAHAIKKVPLKPCKENAERVRHSQHRVDYYNKLEKESTDWEWSTIKA